MKKVLFNWSGGKDSSLCLYKLLKSGQYEVCSLFTSVNREKGRISMHGVREQLLRMQAEKIGIPLHCLMLPGQVDMEAYNRIMSEELRPFREKGITHSAFGDIFLQDLRAYRETRLREIDMKAIFPLWSIPTRELAKSFIDLGFRAVITCIDGSKLDASFVGREYDDTFLKDLPEEVDPCGEYGEFHSFVYDGPIFEAPVSFQRGEVVERSYEPARSGHSFADNSNRRPAFSHWFIDLLPAV